MIIELCLSELQRLRSFPLFFFPYGLLISRLEDNATCVFVTTRILQRNEFFACFLNKTLKLVVSFRSELVHSLSARNFISRKEFQKRLHSNSSLYR